MMNMFGKSIDHIALLIYPFAGLNGFLNSLVYSYYILINCFVKNERGRFGSHLVEKINKGSADHDLLSNILYN